MKKVTLLLIMLITISFAWLPTALAENVTNEIETKEEVVATTTTTSNVAKPKEESTLPATTSTGATKTEDVVEPKSSTSTVETDVVETPKTTSPKSGTTTTPATTTEDDKTSESDAVETTPPKSDATQNQTSPKSDAGNTTTSTNPKVGNIQTESNSNSTPKNTSTTTEDVTPKNNSETTTSTPKNETTTTSNNTSTYNVIYSHNNYVLYIDGGQSVNLSTLIQELYLNTTLSEVKNLTSSNTEVINVTKQGNDYVVRSLKSFTTEEALTITLKDNSTITIKVEDPKVPLHEKNIIDNGDGTFTLELTVTGESEKVINRINVIIIVDRSGSMGDPSGTPGQTRMQATRAAVNNLAQQLLSHNGGDNPNNTVELALVSFATTASTNIAKTTSYSTFSSAVNNLRADGGTNWEAALQQAAGIDFGDNDPTFVIFFSDGAPTFHSTDGGYNNWNRTYRVYGTGQEQTANMNNSYNQAKDDAASLATQVGVKNFYTIFAYGETYGATYMSNLTTAAGSPSANNYSATDTSGLQQAFNDIYSKIEMAGFGNAEIDDGTTSYVAHEATSDFSHLLEVDQSSFKYYKKTNGVETEWADAPEADFDADNGHVTWDLTDEGILENGTTYIVRFKVWPSQATLDLIAELKNTPSKYATLDPNVKKYLIEQDGDYVLKTNTGATLTFTDNRPGGQGDTVDYTDPEPVSTTAVESLAVTKEWDNDIDERDKSPVTLNVLQDGEVWETINLGPTAGEGGTPKWTDSRFIAIGIMLTDANGNVTVLEPGHDYSFGELGSDVYNWELEANTVRPMLVNGKLTILINKGTDYSPTGVEGVDYFRIKKGDTYVYYIKGQEGMFATLTATNKRRSVINISKDVTYSPNASVFEDQTFTFEINVTDKNGEEVWFSVKETDSQDARFITPEDGLVVTGATPEIRDGAPTGYYKVSSGSTFTVSMKEGWNLRIINLPTGTTYTIKEINIDSKFEFDKIEYDKTTYVDNNDNTVEYNPTITNTLVDGEIMAANVKYSYTYINKNVLTDIEVIKIWEDEGYENNRPDNITLILNNETQPAKVVVDGKTWKYTYTNLPVYDANGNEIVYNLSEVSVPGYNTNKSGNAKEGFTITNTFITTEYTVQKNWVLGNLTNYELPESVKVILLANNSQYATYDLIASEGWKHTFVELPTYMNRVPVTYTIKEIKVPGFTTTYSDDTLTITNTIDTTEKEVTKVWNLGNVEGYELPEKITVKLLANGEEYASYDLVAGEDWTHVFENLPTHINGVEVTYTIEEIEVPGFTTTYSDDTLTITNTIDTNSKEVKKIWNLGNVKDYELPEKVTVKLLANGEEYATYDLVEVEDWAHVFENLPTHINGVEVTYTIEEIEVPGFTTTYSDDTLTITNTIDTNSKEVKKIWNLGNVKDYELPEKVTVKLLANGEEYATYDLVEVEDWTHVFTNLPTHINGVEVTYTIEEIEVPGFTTTYSDDTLTITNTIDTTEKEVTKVWDLGRVENYELPEKVTVKLLANGEEYATYDLVAGENWTHVFENLPTHINGVEVTYTIEEIEVPGFTTTYSDDTLTITNTIDTTEKEVTKVWDEKGVNANNLPKSITVKLLANGEEYTSYDLVAADNWKHVFTDLPTYINGKEVEYTVQEVSVDGYTTSINGLNITNTRITTEKEVTKTWVDNNNQDGIRPETIKVILLANGEEYTSYDLVATENWKHVFTNLPTYINGKEVEYTVEEVSVDGYTTSINGLNITNTHEIEKTDLTVSKNWVDNDDQDGIRPENIIIKLLADGKEYATYTLTAEDNWSHTFSNLDVYKNGKKIAYTVEEVSVEGYTTSIDGLNITNIHEVEKTSVKVTKVWDDDNNANKVRPNSVMIALYANGDKINLVELSEANNWTYTFNDLDVYNSGKKIEYTIAEGKVKNYKAEITGDAKDGFTVTNSCVDCGIGDVDEPEEPPITGLNGIENVLNITYLATGLYTIAVLNRKKKYS